MIDVIVQRGAGDRAGDDVVDPLIGALHVALARGRAEMDERAQAMRNETLETVYRSGDDYSSGLAPGQILRVNDSIRGSFAAKVTGARHRAQGGRITSTLQIRRAA